MLTLPTQEASSEAFAPAHNNSRDSIVINQDQYQNQPTLISTCENLIVTESWGDLIIDPPDNAILIHSVNCLGQWGSGVALALAEALPGAYKLYKECCKRQSPKDLLGTALLIPPQKGDYDLTAAADGTWPAKPRRWVYCLFVSEGYGWRTKKKAGKAKPADIVRYTRKALEEVRDKLFLGQQCEMVQWGSEIDHDKQEEPDLNMVWACKFNSGSFRIKWEVTLSIIKDVFAGRKGNVWEGEMRIVSPA